MQKLWMVLLLVLILLASTFLAVSGQADDQTVSPNIVEAYIQPVQVDIGQKVPISVTLVVSLGPTTTQTVNLPMMLDLNINLEISEATRALVEDVAISTETFSLDKPPAVSIIDIEGPRQDITDKTPFYATKFWLNKEQIPTTGSFLTLDVYNVDYANTVWINGELIGILPRAAGKKWEIDQKLFVPASVLQAEENELRIEAGNLKNNYDDHAVRNIQLELNQALVPPKDKSLEILIDGEVHHIGDDTAKEWSVPEPESTFYITFFELPEQPTTGALLVLQTFSVDCAATKIRINDNLLGNLPSTGGGQQIWTEDMHIYVPASHLRAGANSLRVDTVKCNGSLDELMMQNIRILVNK